MTWLKLRVLYALFISNFAIINNAQSSQVLQCRDEQNELVDWFVMYKIPKIRESGNPLIRQGISYLYMTNKTAGMGWRLSNKDVTLKNSMPGNTLASLYKDDIASNSMWVLYNDKPPNGHSSGNYGHAKGAVMANEQSGFWLIHSVPGFPSVPRTGEDSRRRTSKDSSTSDKDEAVVNVGEYGYPDTGKQNGQSFMCISFNTDQIDIVARQLMYNQIIVYRKNLPLSLVKRYPTLADASNQVRIKEPPFNNKAAVRSSGGTVFTSFAKSDKWQHELYDDFVAPQLNADLMVETWLNGRGKLPSECNGSRVLNVESVNLEAANVVFTSTHDHSKWAISSQSNGKNGNWVCVGDINRADTQFNRGGGTVCLRSLELWKSYKNAVNDVEPCPKKKVGTFGKLKNWITSKFG